TTTLSLVVRQTPAVHDEIANLLGQLRRLQDLQVTLELSVITVGAELKVPPTADGKVTDLDDKVSALSGEQLRTFLKAIEESGRAASSPAVKLTLMNGQGAELHLRRLLPTKSTAPLPVMQIAAIIAADRSAVRLPLSIGATKPVDALARGRAFAIRKDYSLLVDVTDEID